MAARKNTRNQTQQKSLPWGPMLISFFVGLFVMFLVHLNDNVTPEQSSNTAAKPTSEKKSKAVEPTFEFYSLLPEMEEVVERPQKAIVTSPVQHKLPQEETAKVADKTKYLLQVGSFRKSSDADAYKAKLAFLGIESKVQTVTIDNKDTWHRVQVGPIIGRKKADAMKSQLRKNKIDSLLVRVKLG
ncbi:MAG: SPOR domain-containing protein [Gammaproteobacteria bacterium]|nr:SPOR domain-containing protein [Gammaproteobacteria bacterium]